VCTLVHWVLVEGHVLLPLHLPNMLSDANARHCEIFLYFFSDQSLVKHPNLLCRTQHGKWWYV